MTFAKLKARLRRTGAGTIDALWQAIGNIRDLYTPMMPELPQGAGYASD